MSDFKNKVLEATAEAAEKELEQGEAECEHCGSRNISAEVWVEDGRLEGKALCNDCNETMPITVGGDDMAEAGEEVEEAIEDLEDTLDDF